MLDPLLISGLRIVFIGTEPGVESERVGHYFASSRNSFYRDLYKSGWTSKVYCWEKDRVMLAEERIGIFDVYDSPERLTLLLSKYKPRIVCFNSKMALERFCRRKFKAGHWEGEKAGQFTNFDWNPIVWALYDSSGQASKYRDNRILLLKELLQKSVKKR